MIYLDNAASMPVSQKVKDKLINCLDIYGNPSSTHDEGMKSKILINEASEIIANRLGCNPECLYYTSGATMSNSMVLQGFEGTIGYSAIEHEDIQLMTRDYSYSMTKIDVCGNGRLDLESLEEFLNEEIIYQTKKLVSVQMANGEIGTIQDIRTISKFVHAYKDCYLHTDATQYLPNFRINIDELNIDALSMSGQKIGCIKGTGLLYIRETLLPYVNQLIYGKQGIIGGTPNVLGIACLGEAFKHLSYDNLETKRLRDKLISGLNGTIVGDLDNRLPNNVCMYFEGIKAQSAVELLNEHGICCSAGSACSAGDDEPSSTLLAIGLNPDQARSCLRFTLSKETTEKEIDETIVTVNNIVRMMRNLNG